MPIDLLDPANGFVKPSVQVSPPNGVPVEAATEPEGIDLLDPANGFVREIAPSEEENVLRPSFFDKDFERTPPAARPLPAWLERNMVKKAPINTEDPEYKTATSILKAPLELVTGAISGVANIPKNVLGTVGDFTGIDTIQNASKAIPEVQLYPEEDKVIGETGQVIGQFGVGGAGALKLLGPAVKGATGLAGFGSKVLRTLGGVVGGSSAVKNDTGTLLYGPNGVLTNWGFDEQGTLDQQAFEKRANIFLDTGTAALGGEAAVKLLGTIFGLGDSLIVEPAVNWWNPKKREENLIRKIMDIAGSISDSDTPEVVFKKRQQIIDIMESNQSTLIKMSDIGGTDKTVKTDAITKLTTELHKADPEGNAARIADINNFGRAAEGPQLEGARQAPNRALGQGMDEVQTSLGEVTPGSAADQVGPNLVKAAEETRIRPLEEELGGYIAKSENLREVAVNEMKTNPVFATDVEGLTGDFVGDITKAGDEKAVQITGKLFGLAKTMTDKKNALFKRIKDLGNEAGVQGSKTIIDSAMKKLSIPAKDAIKKLKIEQRLTAGGMNIGNLEEISNFDISDLVQTLKGQERYTVANELLELKKAFSSEQLDYLVRAKKAGTGPAVKAIKEAHKFYQEDFLPWRNNEILDNIMSASYKNELGAGADVLQSAVEGASKTPGGRLAANEAIDFIAANPTGPNVKEIGEYASVKWMEKAQKIINKQGKLTPEDITALGEEYTKLAPIIAKTNPEKAKALDKFFTKMRDGSLSTDELVANIKVSSEEVEKVKTKVYDVLLKDIATRDGRVPNSYESLKKIFTDTGNENRIADMMKLGESNPIIKDGLKSALNNVLKEEYLFVPGKELSSGAKASNQNNITTFLDKNSSINKYVRQILGDEYAEVYEQVARMISNVNKTAGAKQDWSAVSAAETTTSFTRAVNRVITQIAGVLNPTAARIRTLTGNYLVENSRTQANREFIDRILANTDEFVEIAKRVQASGVETLSKADKEIIKRMLNRGGIEFLAEKNKEDEKSIDKQTKEVLR